MVRVNYTIYGESAEATERAKELKVLLLDNDVQQDVLTMEDCMQILEDSIRGEGLGTATNRTKIGIEMPNGQPGGHLDYVSMEGGINQLGVAAIRIRSHVSLPGGYDRSPNPDHRQRFAQQMSEDLDLEVVSVDSAESAVRGSDMVASCTDPVGPIIPGEWLEPGMHIDSVSTTGHDLDDDACRRLNRYIVYRSGPAQYYHTTPPDVRPTSGSSPQLVERERARVGGEKIATLPQVLLGEATPRGNDSEITYCCSEGTGVQFGALGYLAYERAKERGQGIELPLAWFLQDIKS